MEHSAVAEMDPLDGISELYPPGEKMVQRLAPNASAEFNRILQMLIDAHEHDLTESRGEIKSKPAAVRVASDQPRGTGQDNVQHPSKQNTGKEDIESMMLAESRPTIVNDGDDVSAKCFDDCPNGQDIIKPPPSPKDLKVSLPSSVPSELKVPEFIRSMSKEEEFKQQEKEKEEEDTARRLRQVARAERRAIEEAPRERTWGEKVVQSKGFSFSSAVVILLNTVYIGLQADTNVREAFDGVLLRPGGSAKQVFLVCDTIFCVLFAFELVSRAVLLRKYFIIGSDRQWHLFDTVIVLTSTIELIGDMVGQSMGSGMSVLRAVRLVRILRILRLASSIEAVKNCVRSMQTMLHAIGGVMSSFIPALIVLCICIYICDLFILEAVRGHLLGMVATSIILTTETTANVEELEGYYGNAGECFFTLLAAVTGGFDWTDVSNPLGNISYFYKVFFQMYIIFVMIGVLNIIAGLFVNVAMTATSLDQDMVVDELIKEEARFVKKLVDLLNEGDADGSGTMSWDELVGYLEDERIKAYFNSLDLDVRCLTKVFEILDPHSCGALEVDIEMFAKGCIENRGFAKNIDIVTVRTAVDKIDSKLDMVASHFGLNDIGRTSPRVGSMASEEASRHGVMSSWASEEMLPEPPEPPSAVDLKQLIT